jgi:lipoate-protein ligase B
MNLIWQRDILLAMFRPTCAVINLGQVDYQEAWQLQNTLASEIGRGQRLPTLLLLEHPHTYTFGRRAQADHLLWDESELARRGLSIHWVDRGGDVTYHGPGQLVGYPLLPLAPGGLQASSPLAGASARMPQADYIGYLRKLEETLIHSLARLGVVSGQVGGLTGVWVQPHLLSRCSACRPEMRQHPAKIAAIGIKVDVNGVSRHGFALNVDPDMSYWEGIVACGLAGYPVASLADILHQVPDMELIRRVVTSMFGEVFRYEMVEQTL